MSTTAPNRERQRAAYLITFVCYGSWLHGRDGAVDREHNIAGTPTLAESSRRLAWERNVMTQAPYTLDEHRREATLRGFKEACLHRRWTLLAVHVRPSHVHAVIEADRSPEHVMNALKSYASRALNESGIDEPGRRRWARHGSTRYLWTPSEIAAAVDYLINNQGEPMATHSASS